MQKKSGDTNGGLVVFVMKRKEKYSSDESHRFCQYVCEYRERQIFRNENVNILLVSSLKTLDGVFKEEINERKIPVFELTIKKGLVEKKRIFPQL